MGVGSEVYGAVRLNRKGVGVELKLAYYRQARLNVRKALEPQGGELPFLPNIDEDGLTDEVEAMEGAE